MKDFNIILIVILIFLCFSTGCKKQDDFLNAKPNDALIVPTKLVDFELLLNNEDYFNTTYPNLGYIAGEEFTTLDDNLDGDLAVSRNSYLWAKNIYNMPNDDAWSLNYIRIYYSNVVLDGLKNLSTSDKNKYNRIKGSALFFRALAFYQLMELFSNPYNPNTSNPLGIPIRLNSDLNIKSTRSTQDDCINQIKKDLAEAINLLGDQKMSFPTQPSSAAAYGLLARTNLIMSNFTEAIVNSSKCIELSNGLMNYNHLVSPMYTFTDQTTGYLPENLFHATIQPSYITGLTRAIVNQELYDLYDNDDLRKTMFFVHYNGGFRFKGQYDLKNNGTYCGIALDEIYLIRAEAFARVGRKDDAIKDLNDLLINRYKTGEFLPKIAANDDEALRLILLERRKELCFRGIRWSDLRRLNSDPRFATTLTRTYRGQNYILSANDRRYTFPIPDQEIQLSGIQQNER
ncbi:hypothetical protein HDC92_004313 [Pedobacter sp. AK017]|uniref:RagB/SusD family nutrient uptake outer membrane protein n=1 Tax=Pedobacter sp. AK017 TaxID=2723073 RepID=UPI00161F8B78|nr:RagB/SusD family nutrient uptake outer membrane protein [Pedobacter sp. AK017]MBB5440610.1 hypothetical protein [Pedobacter sp. AK017]